ncbi:MAG: glycine cleavage system aminomethyltransferase GcvT [Deltaproteobacteria bacterium]|nr:glycine cleavage system aminomethyltransferase GcvT [Deltaproteobacteria bacterium]
MPKRTPLYDTHRSLGARVIEFGGWDMPVQYSGILAEHHAVRTKAGLFDLSHMGEIEVSGPHALEALQELVVTDVARVQLGQAQYALMCYPDGGIVDDIIIYRQAEDRFFVCVNAANIDKDFAWMTEHNRLKAVMVDHSDEYALIAVQGPMAVAIVQRLTSLNLAQIKRYWFAMGEVAGVQALVARTGYTGEDGFELFVAADQAVKVWNACLEAGQSDGLLPIGLGARDTLRLEAAYMLYGNDIDAQTTPLEAGLQRLVRFEKPAFLGRDALSQQQSTGIGKQFVGLSMDEAGIPRHGYSLWHDGQRVGVVTSGTQSPSLGVGIALGYVPPAGAAVGTSLTVEIRGRQVRAHIVTRPFYRKG